MMRLTSSFLRMALFGIWLAAGMHSPAEEVAAPNDGVRGVITSQLEAFRKNDFPAAYGFAHSGVKQHFNQAQFEVMVRGGFAPMLQQGAVAFSEVRGNGDRAAVQVTLTDGKGNRSGYQYILEKEDGKWRIAAVIPIELPDKLA